jgi:hypothetical protein
MARTNRLIKIPIAVVLLALVAFLFVRSARDSRANPFTVERAQLTGWTLGIEAASGPSSPLLVLQAPPDLSNGLFRQLFSRAMESLSMPVPAEIPLLLKGEFDRAFAGRLTPEALLDVARSAGLGAGALQPRCMVYRRVSSPERTRQVYFALFDLPAFTAFRAQIGDRLGAAGSAGVAYDPAALSPAMVVAASDTEFNAWLPIKADPDKDCLAPIVAN